ncbi:MAG: metal-sensitive transcriptional regulator [Bryobacteraceae bacterium]
MSKPKKACHEPVDHSRQLPRLRRIEGQIRGLQQMIQNQRYCLDVMNQIEAITAALRRVEGDMLRDHIAAVSRTAVSGRLKDSDCEHLADEIADLVKRRT